MRRIFPIICAVLIIACMAMPAFALGNNNAYTNKYSALPFDYFYIKNYGGPFEYPFAETRRDTNARIDYINTGDNHNIYAYVEHSNLGMYGRLVLDDADVVVTYEMRDKVLSINNTQGIVFNTEYEISNDVVIKITIYGNYRTTYKDTWGHIQFKDVPFSVRYIFSNPVINIGGLLKQTFSAFDVDMNSQYFTYFCMDIEVREDDSNANMNPVRHTWYQPNATWSGTYTSVAEWANSQLVQYTTNAEVPEGFNLGTFLTQSVSAFLDFELFPGFSFDKLFISVLCIGLILWFLKLFS